MARSTHAASGSGVPRSARSSLRRGCSANDRRCLTVLRSALTLLSPSPQRRKLNAPEIAPKSRYAKDTQLEQYHAAIMIDIPQGAARSELEAAHCWFSVDYVAKQPDVTAYKRQARLHQARWREAQGLPMGTNPTDGGPDANPIGSRIPLAFAIKTGANFLTAAVCAAVDRRLAHPEPHQTLAKPRLYADLLSSMPMCFNLFGELDAHPDEADRAVHAWWPDTPGRVNQFRFEWSPGRLDPYYLGNRSAFDAAFELTLDDGGRGVVGIETKYHEHATVEKQPKPERLSRYLEITERSGVFIPGAGSALIGSNLQQIWLDHLLALSMLQHPSANWTFARFIVVAPSANTSFRDAAARYMGLLNDTSTFGYVTVEQLIDTPDALPPALVGAFRRRYLW